jgi:hypothetical protein
LGSFSSSRYASCILLFLETFGHNWLERSCHHFRIFLIVFLNSSSSRTKIHWHIRNDLNLWTWACVDYMVTHFQARATYLQLGLHHHHHRNLHLRLCIFKTTCKTLWTLESGDFEIWSWWHVGKWSTIIIMFSNAYYCHAHVHFLEIIEDSRDNLVIAIWWLLIIMMFLDAHYDDVNEYFLTY